MVIDFLCTMKSLSLHTTMFEAVYSCVLPLGILKGCNQAAVVSGFFRYAIDSRQGALADGLHGLNPRNTAHRYTPVVATSVNVATGKSQVHGGNKACG